MKNEFRLTREIVKHIVKLSKLIIRIDEEEKFTTGFNEVLNVVDRLFELNVKEVEPTHQVTGLFNVFRQDKVDTNRLLNQEQALSNAKRTHNGYFVIDQILEE